MEILKGSLCFSTFVTTFGANRGAPVKLFYTRSKEQESYHGDDEINQQCHSSRQTYAKTGRGTTREYKGPMRKGNEEILEQNKQMQ